MNSWKSRKTEEMQSYTHKVNEWLIENSGCSVLDYCIKFGYYDIAIKIMGFDDENKVQIQNSLKADESLKELYVKYSKNSRANVRKGKNRNWTTYFQDMITGWVLEDLVIEMFRRQGIDIHHNGTDNQRIIDIGDDVNQETDCVITVGNVKRNVELSNEFTTILEDKGYIEKRSPAIYKMWQDKSIWLYREFKSGNYVLIDFAIEPVKTHLRYHNLWDKDVHRYVLQENNKKIRNDRLLAAELISICGCSIDDKEQPKFEEVIDDDSSPHEFTFGGKRIKYQQRQQEEKKTEKSKQEDNIENCKMQETQSTALIQASENKEEQAYSEDVMDNSDDGSTDWNAVAESNSQDFEF